MSGPISATHTFRILGMAFAGLGGLVWTCALVMALVRVVFLQGAERIDGQVVAVENGLPTVEAELPGGTRRLEGAISSTPPSLAVGERVAVYFHADNPGDARIGSTLELWFVPMLLSGIGTPFLAIGAGFLLIVSQRSKRDRELRASGRRLSARIVALEPSLLRINRKPARILIAESREPDGQTRTYRSDAMLVEESQWLGKQIFVYVDPHDPQRYALDLDTP